MDIESLALDHPIFDPLFCTPQDVDGEEDPLEGPEDAAAGAADK